jgi:hypothetical protein
MTATAPEKPWAAAVAGMLDQLTTATSITWGSGGEWRKYRVIALVPLSLPHFDDESMPPMALKKGDTAWLDSADEPGKPQFTVVNGAYATTVPATSVEVQDPGWSVPDHRAGPIELMCFELFPYAALRAGLMKADPFFQGIAKRSAAKGVDGSATWARFFGADLTRKLPKADQVTTLSRGDIVLFCDQGGGAYHTVTASGQVDEKGSPMVYSLAAQDKHPGHFSLAKIADDYPQYPYVNVFTPHPPT